MSLALSQNRFEELPLSPFVRLRELIGSFDHDKTMIDMSIGEPKYAPPQSIKEILSSHFEDFGKYPPIKGTDELREAISNWLKRRFDLSAVTPEKHVLPLCGSREGLFYAAFLADTKKNSEKRAFVLMPNPFYLCYAAAALAAGIRPCYLPATSKTHHLPDLHSIDVSVLENCQLYYYCSPSNPQGAVADESYQKKLLELSRQYGFIIIADECYADIYYKTPPQSILKTSEKYYGDYGQILCLHSLSKRSNLAGMRSGFCAGDPNLIAKFEKIRNLAAPQMPLPIQAASATAWSDDDFVERNRMKYAEKLDLTEEMLASFSGYQKPEAGFFLWLNMNEFGGGTNAAQKLWQEAHIRTIPGEYLSQTQEEQNPGQDYIRMALVGSLEETEKAITRFKDVFRL